MKTLFLSLFKYIRIKNEVYLVQQGINMTALDLCTRVPSTLVKSNSTSTTVEESIDSTLSSAVALVLYKMLRVMNK